MTKYCVTFNYARFKCVKAGMCKLFVPENNYLYSNSFDVVFISFRQQELKYLLLSY